jgi:hypothetical protein
MNAPSKFNTATATAVSARLIAAISGKPFVLSSLYTDDEWDDALTQYRADGDERELEWMLARDEAHERYSDWLGNDYERRWSTDFEDYLPRHGLGHLVARSAVA